MLIDPSKKRNPDPVSPFTPHAQKSKAHCNHCKFWVYWDAIGEAKMEAHFKERHPDRI